MLTLPELTEALARKDPDELIELLRVDSEGIVLAFEFLIEERFEEFVELIEAETEEFQDHDNHRG